ncbi:MAG: TlyA family RNA methyltransferase [Candidatus Dormibacteria bacterium]
MTPPRPPRLDDALVSRGVAVSLHGARALIAAGLVEVDGHRADRADVAAGPAAAIRVTGREHPWASRGGLKLAAALDAFAVAVLGRTCLDAGASTGGFTDVLLARGAARVYAVDVGRGLLHPRVAADPRVVVMDRTNLRTLAALGGEAPSLVTLDLSFISLRSVLPALERLAPAAEVVALFKPQFEVERGTVGRGGVVSDGAAARAALDGFTVWLGERGHALLHEPVAAAVRGAKGNQEWLVHAQLGTA